MAEPLVQISSQSSPSPEEIAGRSFPVLRRGFDPEAVRKFLDEVAGLLRDAKSRESSLRVLLEEAQHQVESPRLDEATLSAAIGAETGRVLQAAHEAAHDVLEKAESKAAALIASAESSSNDRVRSAQQEASTVLTRARAEADAAIDGAKRTCMEMLEEAREARRRILGDLAERRRSLHSQLEQLRAGKDSLAEVVDAVATSVEAIRGRLVGAEEEAREAADVAARYPGALDDGVSIDELVANALVNFVPTVESAEILEVIEPIEPIENSENSILFDGRAQEEEIFVLPSGSAVEIDVVDQVSAVDESPADESPAIASDESKIEGDSVVAVDERSSGDAVPASDVENDIGESISVESDQSNAAESTSPVDELFAKIRASREQQTDQAHAVLDRQSSEASKVAKAEGDATDDVDQSALHSAKAAIEIDAHDDGVIGSALEIEVDLRDDDIEDNDDDAQSFDSEDSVVAANVDPAFTRRDDLLQPEFQKIAKSLKRALASEQNELLDAIRQLGKSLDTAALFDEVATTERLSLSCAPGLTEAYRAGNVFGREFLGGNGDSGDDGDVGEKEASVAGDEVAGLVAKEIVANLNRRIREGFVQAGTDQGALATVVGSAFREWKGSRVEAVAGDFATHAFSLGTRSFAVARGSEVSWLLDESGAECGDCDDNALAGGINATELFPTGQMNPPAHPGCRCLLVSFGS